MSESNKSVAKEMKAIQSVVDALSDLEPAAVRRVLDYALSHLGISEAPSVLQKQQPAENQPNKQTDFSPNRSSSAIMDIKTLKLEKNPGSGQEMAAIVAYYLSEVAPEADRKSEITSADAEKYFKQAQYKLPSSMKDTLKNAKNSGYLDSAGHGKYKLNPVGYNLVTHTLAAKKSRS